MNLHCGAGFAVLVRRLPRYAETPSSRVQNVPRRYDPEIGTEISRNRRAIRAAEKDRAWPTQSNPVVYARGGVLAQPLQWAQDDTVATSGTKRPASMKTERRANYV